jgi:hypothetical protein
VPDEVVAEGIPSRAGRLVYRRLASLLLSLVTGLVLGALAVALTVGGGHRSLGDALVPWAILLPLMVLAVVGGVLPRFVVAPDRVEVHNVFTRHVIPMRSVQQLVEGRLGMAVRTTSGRLVPIAVFGRSTLANVFTGNAAARRAAAEVERRTAANDAYGDAGSPAPEPPRQVNRPVVAVVVAVLLFSAVVLLLQA